MSKQTPPQRPFTLQASSLEVIALNDVIMYGLKYLRQHPDIPSGNTIALVNRIQQKINVQANTLLGKSTLCRGSAP